MKILYIYDIENWAIHRVGKLWLKDIGHEVLFKDFKSVTQKDIDQNDLVWYGFTRLYFKTIKADLKKSVIAIHDPSEIFAPSKYWKQSLIPLTFNLKVWYNFITRFFVRLNNIRLLKMSNNVVTISKEMQSALLMKGIKSKLINTTTEIPIKNNVQKSNISIFSVANNHIRKNFGLLKKIKKFCDFNRIAFELKGANILSEKEYINFIDTHNIYICTSCQEGGPLPPMDAMARGSIVLTTPVGQIQEMIKNGENGFICKSYEEFVDKIKFISENKNILKKMSKNASMTIKHRTPDKIKKNVKNFLVALKL